MIFTFGFITMVASFFIWYGIGMPVNTKVAKFLQFTGDVGVLMMVMSVCMAIWKYMP